MKRNKMFSHFFKKNKRYDLVSQSNESQQKPNAHFQAVGFDVYTDVLKYLRMYEKKYYAEETSHSNSMEAYYRLDYVANLAQMTWIPPFTGDTPSSEFIKYFKKDMVCQLQDKIYLSDYLHYWLNIEKEKLNYIKSTWRYDEELKKTFEEENKKTFQIHYTLLFWCLDGKIPNRKLNNQAVNDIVNRMSVHHYAIHEEVKKYYNNRRDIFGELVPSVSRRKPIDPAHLKKLQQILLEKRIENKKENKKTSNRNIILGPGAERLI
ncbi:hypothetical protein UA3_00685 [Enterococcus faecium EnGen0263]|uniref:hypothetical protein n=1 Tax=Enterococcus faecium TaxID=1352 RepID=UPI0003306A27|nr:hypothetical protein [Enterococcus faecium]EOH57174.1 hypothetical protein UA3_00685 [Enterococcus faecium EnGen0263]